MDLNKLWKRCSACRYRTVEDFKRELSLVASNCRAYCQDKFPSLPPAADAAVKVCVMRRSFTYPAWPAFQAHISGLCRRCLALDMAAAKEGRSPEPALMLAHNSLLGA